MTIRVIFFGRLKDDLSCQTLQLDWKGGTGNELLAMLRQQSSTWAEALTDDKVFRLAINQEIARLDAPIPAAAEVAILPPVTGG